MCGCPDETFFTKKKKNKGGFFERTTQGHQTIIMGFLELDLATRTATGACVLIQRHKVLQFLVSQVNVTTNAVEGLFGRLATLREDQQEGLR